MLLSAALLPGPRFIVNLWGSASKVDEISHFLHAKWRVSEMDDRVAIWTNGPQILNRIHLVIRSNARKWLEVMNVREPGHHLSVHSHEIETAEVTRCPVMPSTLFPSTGIALVAVYEHGLDRAFEIGVSGINLVRKSGRLPLFLRSRFGQEAAIHHDRFSQVGWLVRYRNDFVKQCCRLACQLANAPRSLTVKVTAFVQEESVRLRRY